MDAFWEAPPVSRSIVAFGLAQSLAVRLGLLNPMRLVFIPTFVFNPRFPELWRLPTSLLLTTGGVGMLLEFYFLYTYSSFLERDSSRFSVPGSFVVYIVFVGTIISTVAGYILGSPFHLKALGVAVIYTWSQENIDAPVSLWMVRMRAQFLPWALVAMDFLNSGLPAAGCAAAGIVAAHAYEFLTRIYPAAGGRQFIQTPNWVRKLFTGIGRGASSSASSSSSSAAYTTYRPPTSTARSSDSDFFSSFTGNWRNRGTGRRLGGD